MQAPLRQSRDSSMWGRLYASLMVREFRCLRSIQNLKLPSFLRTRTTALAHGLHECQMAPILSMSCKMVSDLLELLWGYPSIPILKRDFIIKLNFVFDIGCASQFQIGQRQTGGEIL